MISDTYDITEKLEETDSALTFRGTRVEDNHPVVIRTLKEKSPTRSERTRFLQEYETIASFTNESIVKVYDVIETDGRFSIIMEDFPGIPLKEYLKVNRADTALFLTLSVKLASALGWIHKKGLTHRDIRPENILIDPGTNEIKITNFGISAIITGTGDEIYHPEYITGALPYISPEQTGRMNINIDYRTDIYSLGITFFEMVTGIIPFISRDPLETIHSHIARKAPSPDIFQPELPSVLTKIIEKMMEKSPEDRYQNAYGLLADLDECLRQYEEKKYIEHFEPGRKDIADRFIIPQKVFGRENEVRRLMRSFRNVCNGYHEIILTTGVSGIGKSAVIHELHKLIVARKGYFISGKYEQYRSATPYSAIIQAYSGIIRQILSENEQRLTLWKTRLRKKLGANAGIITEMIPDLELIIGRQPSPPACSAEDAQQRFIATFEKFVAVFADKNHPVTLFLDDIQWTDLPSLNLLTSIILNEDIRYLFIIFSYRHTEIDETHFFHEMIRKTEQSNCLVSRIHLEALAVENITDLIANFLKCSAQKAGVLGEIVFQKTAGNPFFINQFLKMLYDEKKLINDPVNGWQWNETDISRMKVTENVVELMAAKLTGLPASILEALKTGACIGNRFDLETIAHTLNKSMGEALYDLNTAITEGYLRIQDDMFFFHHDRIQEAAYSLIPEPEKAKYHYKIGQRILKKLNSVKERDAKLFYITNQLNYAIPMIQNIDERQQLAWFNYQSGMKAKASTAYDPAMNYFDNAIRICEPSWWEDHYDQVLSLYTEAAETAGFTEKPDKMKQLSEIVLQKAKSVTDRVRIYEIRINSCFAGLDYNGAIDNALTVLSMLGFKLDKTPSVYSILMEYLRARKNLAGKSFQELAKMPETNDPAELAIAKILYLVGISAMFSSPKLYVMIILSRVNHYITRGRTPYSGVTFAAYGSLMIVMFNTIKKGIRYGELALSLTETPDAEITRARTFGIYDACIRHWHEAIPECQKASHKAYRLAEESGDRIYSAIAIAYSGALSFFVSGNWIEFKKEMRLKLKANKKCRQKALVQLHEMLLQFVENATGVASDPCYFQGTYFDESTAVQHWIETDNKNNLAYYYTLKIATAYLFNRFDLAAPLLVKAEKHLATAKAHFIYRGFLLFRALVAAEIYNTVNRKQQKAYRRIIKTTVARFKKWEKNAPAIFQPWTILVEAEYRILNNKKEIGPMFDTAINLWKEAGSPLMTAVCLERAGRYYRSINRDVIASAYLNEACAIYQKTAIISKARKLEKELTEASGMRIPGRSGIDSPPVSKETSTTLDLSTIIKSAHAFSGEIILERLIRTVMSISIESAGAMHGFLILSHNDRGWFIEAEGSVERSDVKTLQSIPLNAFGQICSSVVHYVIRTEKPVVLNNAFEDGEYTNDPYIKKFRIKSLMAAPVKLQGKINGVIYLENNLTRNAFSHSKLEVIETLASQAAISLENARMFENLKKAKNELRLFNAELEKRVEERTAELKKAYDQISKMANTDPLTGISNRREITERIEYEMTRFKRSGKPFSMVISDLDNFKTINDTYGHDCGDYILATTAQIIKNSLRKQDSVSRWGGEEFLILLPETDQDGAVVIAEKIREKIDQSRFSFNAKTITLSVTSGVSTVNNPSGSINDYFRAADQALYRGKKGGKNRVVASEDFT